MKLRHLLGLSFAACLILAPMGAQASVDIPGIVSKTLQSLGLQSSPGRQGNKAYHRGDYPGAIRKYAEAAAEQPSPALDYNTGNALYAQKRYPEAAAAYEQALKNAASGPKKDPGFEARAHYNLGNAYFRKGEAGAKAGAQDAISDYREALAHYKKSLEIRPGNRDAQGNLELAQVRLKELLDKQDKQPPPKGQPPKPPEPDARAKEALARALQLAQERRYEDARAVLEDILRTDATAASYRSHLQRLDDVTKILKGEPPSSPQPRDPRAAQKGLGI